jgi:prevent-host-death family protein
MNKTISATEARIRFGELIQEAQKGPVTVEREGKPVVIVISKHHYDQLVDKTQMTSWQDRLDELHQFLQAELGGRELPEPAEILREMRKERDERYDLH